MQQAADEDGYRVFGAYSSTPGFGCLSKSQAPLFVSPTADAKTAGDLLADLGQGSFLTVSWYNWVGRLLAWLFIVVVAFSCVQTTPRGCCCRGFFGMLLGNKMSLPAGEKKNDMELNDCAALTSTGCCFLFTALCWVVRTEPAFRLRGIGVGRGLGCVAPPI